MDHLLQEPKSFREMVEADLRRAGRLIVKVQDEIDPQWRIATPSGDWWLATTLSGDDHGRRSILRALSTFMAWKQAMAFTLASELLEPDCVYCCGVSGSERWAALAPITRHPRPWTNANFGPVEWLPESSIDPAVAALLPTAPRPLTPKEVSAMVKWFGKDGKFPAINMATGEVGA